MRNVDAFRIHAMSSKGMTPAGGRKCPPHDLNTVQPTAEERAEAQNFIADKLAKEKGKRSIQGCLANFLKGSPCPQASAAVTFDEQITWYENMLVHQARWRNDR